MSMERHDYGSHGPFPKDPLTDYFRVLICSGKGCEWGGPGGTIPIALSAKKEMSEGDDLY